MHPRHGEAHSDEAICRVAMTQDARYDARNSQ